MSTPASNTLQITHAENMRRGNTNGNKTHCPQGHSDYVLRGDGSRRCRTCDNERSRLYRRGRV